MTTTAGELAGGVLIPLVAGVLNGSWNAAFSPVSIRCRTTEWKVFPLYCLQDA